MLPDRLISGGGVTERWMEWQEVGEAHEKKKGEMKDVAKLAAKVFRE